MKKILNGTALLALVVALGACQDLEVANPMDPDRDRALKQPASVEALIGGSWEKSWSAIHSSSYAIHAFPTAADEMTSTYDGYGQLEFSSLPREAFNNDPESVPHDVARTQWKTWYEVLSDANEGLGAIERGLVIQTGGDNTARARTFAKLMQGVSLGYLGMLFDKAYVADETTDLYDLPPYSAYPQVVEAAVRSLEEAAVLAESNTFTLPDTWITGLSLTSADVARIAHSYAARFLVYSARTPEERAAVEWSEVVRHVDAGITADLGVTIAGFSDPGYSNYWRYTQTSSTLAQHRADYRLIGPADVSGKYQEWLATPPEQRTRFDITTPDRRITGVGGPTTAGTYFRYMSSDAGFDASYGGYRMSAYQWYRYKGKYSTGTTVAFMTVDEMRLLKAEALLRLNRPDEAAELINVTRVANGQLPPVTADGVTEAVDCVPHTDAGACGSLLDALMYERMIELAGLEATRAYLDRRGFGTLAEGTFLHLPVPGEELLVTGQPIYTFGGVGGTGSAQ